MWRIQLRVLIITIVMGCHQQDRKIEAVATDSADTHCSPGNSSLQRIRVTETGVTDSGVLEKNGMVWIPAGIFQMGSPDGFGYKDEHPAHPVSVDGFWMDATEVTNVQFAAFVKATNYKTIAERAIDAKELAKEANVPVSQINASMLEPGSLIFHATDRPVPLNNPGQWWSWTSGADWKHPEGPGSDLKNKDNFPVVHIAYADAVAYAKWAGKRLPREAEWEWAAMGGNHDAVYAWGGEAIEYNKAKANSWNGEFPSSNTAWDGFVGLAPVKQFSPNRYSLYDMSGNVWEWCSDLYNSNYYNDCRAAGLQKNPKGPSKSYDPDEPDIEKHVIRGGSFLCNDSYCSGYRVARRMKTSTNTSLNHTGFRCVADSVTGKRAK